VRSAFDADPWTVHQVFRIKQIRPWALWLDGRSRAARPAERRGLSRTTSCFTSPVLELWKMVDVWAHSGVPKRPPSLVAGS
jgi:hypothetical protein